MTTYIDEQSDDFHDMTTQFKPLTFYSERGLMFCESKIDAARSQSVHYLDFVGLGSIHLPSQTHE